jgi:outer membrane protein insertion porin family
VLIELNNLSRSVPQLDFEQIADACDEVLRVSGSNRKALRAPKYEISFSGNSAFSSSLLTEKLAEYVAAYDTLQKEWIGDVIGGPVDYGLYRLNRFYSSHGYLNVHLTSDKKTTERGQVISVNINEGKTYRLGKIRISGAKLFSPERIRAMLKLREGELADGEAIDKWLDEDLRKLYHDQGYVNYYPEQDRQFRVESQRGGAELIDINVRIEERAQYRVETIEFQGKTTIRKIQLSRVMSLHEGEVFSEKQLDDSIVELNKLGLTLDKDKDIGVTENHARETVAIKIILDKQGRANESFNRSTRKRSWFP